MSKPIIHKSIDAMIWSLRIFAKYTEGTLDAHLDFNAYHDQLYAPVSLETIPQDSMDGMLLSTYGWLAMDDSWVWLT